MKNDNISNNKSGNNDCSNEKSFTPSSNKLINEKKNYNISKNNGKHLPKNFIFKEIKDFYKVGIENYCAIIDTNVKILNELKKKYLKIIFDMIQLNLGNKFSMKFGIYGSYATELSIEGSDIDVGIYYEKKLEEDLNFQEELYNCLKENEKTQNELSYETKEIFKASIPRIIVKIKIDENTKRYINNYGNLLDYEDMNFIKIDFTFYKNEGDFKKNLDNVDYIKSNLEEYPQIKPVVQIGKRFLRRLRMNEVYKGGISSYSLFLMVLYIIKMSGKPSKKIKTWYLLFKLFEIFSFFNFSLYGINENNVWFPLGFENNAHRPYILDPLTGLNICRVGSCSGLDINFTFKHGYDYLESEKKYYKEKFEKEISSGFNPFKVYKQKPIKSIVNLLTLGKKQSKNFMYILKIL